MTSLQNKSKRSYCLVTLVVFLISASSSLSASDNYNYRGFSTKPNYGQAIGKGIQSFLAARQANQEMELRQQELAIQQMIAQNQMMQGSVPTQQFDQQANARRQQYIEALLSALLAYDQLKSGILKYVTSFMQLKPLVYNDFLIYCEVKNAMYQAAEQLKQGKKAAEAIKTFEGKTDRVKLRIENSFTNLASAIEYEIAGFKSGVMFWKANENFERAKALKINALEDAINALKETIDLMGQAISTQDPAFINVQSIANSDVGKLTEMLNYYKSSKSHVPSTTFAQN